MKRHFLPNIEKGTRARLLSSKAFLVYISFFISLLPIFRYFSINHPEILGFATDIATLDLLEDTNRERTEKGLGPLRLDSNLNAAAMKKARDMFSANYWAHISPSGTTPWSFILASDYDYRFAGENLARDFNDSQSVVQAWMESPTHRENIINPRYEDVGFAVVNGELKGEETTLVVQMFGTRVSKTLAKSPEVSKTSANAQRASEVYELAPAGSKEGAVRSATLTRVKPLLDGRAVGRYLVFAMGAFVSLLFILDIYYLKKKGVYMLSGNTLAHFILIVLALAGIYYATTGSIL